MFYEKSFSPENNHFQTENNSHHLQNFQKNLKQSKAQEFQ